MKISVGCLLRSALEIKAVGVKEGSNIGQKKSRAVDSYQTRLMELPEADLISASKVMLKILQVRLQQYMN